MRIRAIYSVPFILRFGITGITLYPFIFFPYSKKEILNHLPVVRHELVHVAQIRKVGWLSFYVSYWLYYFAGLIYFKSHMTAYLGIPAEYEAYRTPFTKLTTQEKRELGL